MGVLGQHIGRDCERDNPEAKAQCMCFFGCSGMPPLLAGAGAEYFCRCGASLESVSGWSENVFVAAQRLLVKL
jgi:hypothetical protein